MVVVGDHAPAVRAHVAARLGEAAIAVQDPPLGTGHAVLAAKAALAGFDGDVLVTYADGPLLTADGDRAAVRPARGRRRPGGAGLRGGRARRLRPAGPRAPTAV